MVRVANELRISADDRADAGADDLDLDVDAVILTPRPRIARTLRNSAIGTIMMATDMNGSGKRVLKKVPASNIVLNVFSNPHMPTSYTQTKYGTYVHRLVANDQTVVQTSAIEVRLVVILYAENGLAMTKARCAVNTSMK